MTEFDYRRWAKDFPLTSTVLPANEKFNQPTTVMIKQAGQTISIPLSDLLALADQHRPATPDAFVTVDLGERWEEGIDHDPRSEDILKFIAEYDHKFSDSYFDWRVGGDGDNGEALMYQLDEYYSAVDKAAKEA